MLVYYEERVINGVLHWRGTPNGEWQTVSESATAVYSHKQMVDAVLEEREACAKACDECAERETLAASDGYEGAHAAEACATAIRARSDG